MKLSLNCDYLNERYQAVLSCGTVYYAVQGGFNFWVCGWNPMVWPFKWKLLSSTFLWYCLLCCTRWFKLLSLWMESLSVTNQMKATKQYFPVVLFIMLYKVVLTFESVDEILKCDHSYKSYWAVLCCSIVSYAVQGGSNFWVCGRNTKVWPFKWKLILSCGTTH